MRPPRKEWKGYSIGVAIESFALDKIQSWVVVKLFVSLLIGRYQTQCVAGGVFFPGGSLILYDQLLFFIYDSRSKETAREDISCRLDKRALRSQESGY
jgi:hypothetical protein